MRARSRHGRRGAAGHASLALGALVALLAACSGAPDGSGSAGGGARADDAPAAAKALDLADAYVRLYYEQFPEAAYEFGYADAPADRLSDRSLEALDAWHATEDSLADETAAIDPSEVEGTEAEVPFAYLRDRLEAYRGLRVCRAELWNVSPTWPGWTELLPAIFEQQPVGTPEERRAALARAHDVPRYLDTEIANLREGMQEGYTAPVPDVIRVLAQIDGLLATPAASSSFVDPGRRSGDAALEDSLAAVAADEIYPAVRRYRAFLADEYRPRARTEIGVTANPDGDACYRAAVRFHTTLSPSPEEIHQTGLRQMERIHGEMQAIARELFGTEDVRSALEKAQTDPRFLFRTGDAVLAYARAAVERARDSVPGWFGFVPSAKVVVKAYPAWQKRTGGGFYTAGPPGGTGTYMIGTYQPETLSKAGVEATTFHETYPGHHMQASVALEMGHAHPITKYFYNSGMGEGWALYTEGLADEMGLYSSPIDRLGMLSNEALRAARLVVDPGMHALGWSRERAIRYMRENTAESDSSIAYEVDRYLADPAQATAYLLGSLEIRRLREEAKARLGDRFDVKGFHDRVLEHGTVSLPVLRAQVEEWVEAREGTGGGSDG